MKNRIEMDFGKTGIPALFSRMLYPTLAGMLFSVLFTITDGIFVGRGLGSDALAAVNIAAPLFRQAPICNYLSQFVIFFTLLEPFKRKKSDTSEVQG